MKNQLLYQLTIVKLNFKETFFSLIFVTKAIAKQIFDSNLFTK